MVLGNQEKREDLAANQRMDDLRRREEEAKRRQVWKVESWKIDGSIFEKLFIFLFYFYIFLLFQREAKSALERLAQARKLGKPTPK